MTFDLAPAGVRMVSLLLVSPVGKLMPRLRCVLCVLFFDNRNIPAIFVSPIPLDVVVNVPLRVVPDPP